MYRSGPAPLRERFIEQFDEDGGAWLYRFKMTGPAYRVTDAEKDAFVAMFDRRQRQVRWAALPILVGFLIVLLWPPSWFETEGVLRNSSWYLPFVLVVTVDHIANIFTWRVPPRILKERTPVAPALPRAERQRLALDSLPLTVVVGTTTITSLLLLFFALERPPIGSVGVAVIVASVAALVWALVQGTRKYLLARADHAANNLI